MKAWFISYTMVLTSWCNNAFIKSYNNASDSHCTVIHQKIGKLTGHISETIHHWSLILHVSNTFNIPNMCTKFRGFLERVCQKFVKIIWNDPSRYPFLINYCTWPLNSKNAVLPWEIQTIEIVCIVVFGTSKQCSWNKGVPLSYRFWL